MIKIKSNFKLKNKFKSKFKSKSKFLLFIFSLPLLCNSSFACGDSNLNSSNKTLSQQNKTKLITVIQSVEHPALDQSRQGIYDEIMKSSLGRSGKIKWIYESAQGDMSLAQQISKKFISQKPDIIVAIPTSVSQILIKLTSKNKIPVVFASVTDPVAANLVKDLNNPGRNITGVSNFIDVKPQLKMYKKIMPNLNKLGFIYNPGEVNSIKLLKETIKAANELNMEVVAAEASKTNEVSAATSSIINNVDAIYITNDNTALSAFRTIVKVANKAKKPVFVSDVDITQQGALASLGPNQYQVGTKTGKIALKILNNEQSPAGIPVEFPEDVELFINLDAAKKINFKVPKEIIKKADKVIENKQGTQGKRGK